VQPLGGLGRRRDFVVLARSRGRVAEGQQLVAVTGVAQAVGVLGAML
jgi:hypothetical protein